MITRIDNLFKSCLQRYFDDTDNEVDYVSKPIWEFNENDYLSGNPIMFLALPLDFKTEDSKSGARTDTYMIELYFFKQGNIKDHQDSRTPRVDEMKLLCDKVIDEYLGTSEGVEPGKVRRVTDVYNFNDSNIDGVRIILDFEYTYNCNEDDGVQVRTTGDNLLLYSEWHSNEGLFQTEINPSGNRRLVKEDNENGDEYFNYINAFAHQDGDYLLAFDYATEFGGFVVKKLPAYSSIENTSTVHGKFKAVVPYNKIADLSSLGIQIATRPEDTGFEDAWVGYINNPSLKEIK